MSETTVRKPRGGEHCATTEKSTKNPVVALHKTLHRLLETMNAMLVIEATHLVVTTCAVFGIIKAGGGH